MINSGNTTTANMLTALADERDRLATAHKQLMQSLDAANARADQARDAAQSELDDCLASDWPIWATQIYNTLKEFGYRYDHFDGIDLPEDVSEFLRGFPENAASELMEQRDDALQELATLRASEAAALARESDMRYALQVAMDDTPGWYDLARDARNASLSARTQRLIARQAIATTTDKEPKS